MARKTTGTPGRPAGAKTGTRTNGKPETPGATSGTTPETGTSPAAPGTAPTPPKTDDKGPSAPTPETASAAKSEAGSEGSAKPRPASAAVDIGTTSRTTSSTAAAPSSAGGVPAVKRAARSEESAGTENTQAKPAASETAAAKPRDPATAATTALAPRKSGGLGAGLIGGLISAGLVLGAGWLWLDRNPRADEFDTRLAALERDTAPLADEIEGLRGETETRLSDIDTRLGTTETGLADLTARLDASASDLDARLDTLGARLTETEANAGPDGTLAREAVARWQSEVDALRDDLAAQAAEIATMAERAAQEVSAAERTAEEIEAEAAAVAARARARATLAEIEAALETGEPYPALLEELQATAPAEIPAALTAPASEGVASRAELIEAFPEPARTALATARREGLSGEEGGRVAGFFRDTLQLRSTAPGEGGTTDAVLSRAEAALRDGRLTEALSEIEALPEPVREAMSDWIAPARTRAEALAAADTLSQSLTEN
ncbi:mitofilin family membrane protein [Limimaricola litoreus]